jgi:hypothetical protein
LRCPGDLDDLWDFDDLLDRLVPLRAEILEGDLRPLYLAHLAMACDGNHDPEKTKEAPVPAGLKKLSNSARALAELYGMGDTFVAAAAQHSPPSAARDDPRNQHAEWLQGQRQAKKDAWPARLMADPDSTVRSELLAEFGKSRTQLVWPTVRKDRAIAELEAAADEIQRETNRRLAEKAARQKAKRLEDIAAALRQPCKKRKSSRSSVPQTPTGRSLGSWRTFERRWPAAMSPPG